MRPDIVFVGGDLRTLVCANELSDGKYTVGVYGLDEYEGNYGNPVKYDSLDDADGLLILPLPWSVDAIRINCPLTKKEIRADDVFKKAEGRTLLGGRFDKFARELAVRHGVRLIDYFDREETAVLNAVPTAEGALEIAIRELNITVAGSKTLVLGYGRVGRMTASLFASVGACVTVAARSREQLAWAKASGCRTADIRDMRRELSEADIIINTVPQLILGENEFAALSREKPLIDLASYPGCVSDGDAERFGVRLIRAPSLPGKTAPVTAGRIICESIKNILSEEGYA
ncbi:MAG: dipicolinate synthase [Clostridia bacterium]|nr:dipicolinate synthase [Clostridia bacterium]